MSQNATDKQGAVTHFIEKQENSGERCIFVRVLKSPPGAECRHDMRVYVCSHDNQPERPAGSANIARALVYWMHNHSGAWNHHRQDSHWYLEHVRKQRACVKHEHQCHAIPTAKLTREPHAENCRKCTIALRDIALQTATLEVWRCVDSELQIGCYVGTLQADLCEDVRLSFAESKQLGSLVQAGMHKLRLSFLDGSFPDYATGLEELRAAHPDDAINDDTDQYITRIIGGELLTERIVRLHNDFPTTMREKAAFDAETVPMPVAPEPEPRTPEPRTPDPETRNPETRNLRSGSER